MALDAARVHKPVRKVRKLLKGLPKQPKPQQVHDLRTNTRRLEAIFTALAFDSRSNGRMLKDLARVRE